ncbi:COP9 signalosome complex subunit 8-like isoform X2 [Corticium candelabrum]|uniref:COP9 signalosome complex subunit 8-like isoform X2 n=1 Tax=Corticium candelabrum TaxID=121492 RepID=UPI002E25A147|nr:COP9 signalosome complex subunit 8-like isoform X2 [Corticium candelabrum]
MEELIRIGNFEQVAAYCEQLEIEAPLGVTSPDVYGTLLAVYLVQNDINNARFLWKRIPEKLKKSNGELALLWSIGQKLWKRDYPGVHVALNQSWPPHIQPIMTALKDQFHRNVFDLIARAYDSISIQDMASMLGVTAERAAQAVEAGWRVSAATGVVRPKKKVHESVTGTESHQQLAAMTEYVAFLEN